ncbi:type II secretion system F family protein [Desulfitobacterium metallireducens]|uniref:Type II secretion protein F n=1 Tax=Desulfitobacterium metallireducens DSM 15288 TaxID=871968 RepID=W0EE03_9FIRM|nr:type II secretion system F family protein [Desulfitobacterium metallireducens]AHF07434.1 type II secretion protein F [Desulfitobacterium metallireducens DSM 15288]
MQYSYVVINEKMALQEGTLEAADREAALRIISGNAWQLITLKEKGALANALGRSFQRKVNYESISAFCSQLAMMIRSGANLVRGIEILQSQMEDKKLKNVLGILNRGVSRGDSLSTAMRETEGALPELLINLVAVGEESGNLDTVLVSMAEYYERENFIRKKISSAAVYPVILTFVLIGLVIFFMKFMLPELTGMMAGTGQSLPAITQAIIDISNFINQNGLYLWVGVIAFILLMTKGSKIPTVRYYLDAVLFRIPVFGNNLKNVILARFSRTLALFLHSAIPIVPILNSMERIVGNQVPSHAIVSARERIINGETLAQAFGQEKFFDPMIIQMISIGEETGRLEELMSEVANSYDKKVELGISKMVALVEPIFTLIIGIVAGGLIIAIALPIFSMSTNLK